jgi:hypothetical protein
VYVEDLSDLEREEQLRSFWRDNWLTIVAVSRSGSLDRRMALLAVALGAAGRRRAVYTAVLEALRANKREDAVTRASALRRSTVFAVCRSGGPALTRAAVERA